MNIRGLHSRLDNLDEFFGAPEATEIREAQARLRAGAPLDDLPAPAVAVARRIAEWQEAARRMDDAAGPDPDDAEGAA